MTDGLVHLLGRFTAERAVPESAAKCSWIAIVDCLGCTLAGAADDSARILRASLLADDNSDAATVIGTGLRASPRNAALANGTAAHALDYDDINWTLYGHPSVAILPAVLALAETENASTQNLVDAYAIGVEVAAKIGRWANPDLYLKGWHATGVLGALGAAAAAARLLGLNAAACAQAIAIAASESAGIRRNFGTMTKPFHAGRAAESGIVAARLAAGGFTASAEALEGRFGFIEAFGGRMAPDPGTLSDALGAPWDVNEPGIVLKRYPSCGATHCALDALLALKTAHGIRVSDVQSVHCGAEPLASKVLQYPRPTTGLEGKFSMPFCLAIALLDGPPALRHFSADWISDPRVTALLPLIELVDRDDLGGGHNDAVPATVTVTLRDGRVLSETVRVPSGDPRAPLPQIERENKFMECAKGALGVDGGHSAWRALADAVPNAPAANFIRTLAGTCDWEVA
jgi:2-methylcitrate dehydratase PrpD